MSIEIKINEAYKGDCILLRYGEKTITNIVIDSGPASFARGFRNLINEIKSKGERVNLLILTHIDNDHIMGFKKYISNDKNDCNIIDKIWLNGEGIGVYKGNQLNSPKNISALVSLIKEKQIRLETPICEGIEECINEAILKVITPKYNDILKVAEVVDKNKLHSSSSRYIDLDEIIKNDKYKSDRSYTNKASISFIFSYNNKKIAFLGDAHAEDIIEGKKKYFDEEIIDIIKISHHGSKYNTSDDLLKSLKGNKFIISSNSPVDKEIIARIVKHHKKPEIFCNYNWWKGNKYFTINDKERYLNKQKILLHHKVLLKAKEDI